MSSKRRPTLRLVWLESFIVAAEHLSVTKAAKALGGKQSTISRDLIDLEGWLGRALFTGDIPKVLTPYGESFLPTAMEVVRVLQEARAKPDIAVKQKPVSAADIKL